MAKNNVIDLQNEFSKKVEEQTQKQNKAIQDRLTNLAGMLTNEDLEEGLGPIMALLSMSDSDFSLFAEIFLDEMNKAMANSGQALLMAQALNMSGSTIEDLNEGFQVFIIDLEKQTELTPMKKDFLRRLFSIIVNAVSETQGISKKVINIPIQLCKNDSKIPCYAKVGDAGMDIFAAEEITINPGQTVIVPTGIKVAIPRGYELQVRPKSGISAKTKLRVANAPGTIDSGYRDEVGIIIENVANPIEDITYDFAPDGHPIITSILHGATETIEKGQKIAQLVLSEVIIGAFETVKDIGEIGGDRGGGFGSTSIYSKEDSRYGTDLV